MARPRLQTLILPSESSHPRLLSTCPCPSHWEGGTKTVESVSFLSKDYLETARISSPSPGQTEPCDPASSPGMWESPPTLLEDTVSGSLQYSTRQQGCWELLTVYFDFRKSVINPPRTPKRAKEIQWHPDKKEYEKTQLVLGLVPL